MAKQTTSKKKPAKSVKTQVKAKTTPTPKSTTKSEVVEQPKKKKTWLWIILGLLGLMMLCCLCSAGALVIASRKTSQSPSSIVDVLQGQAGPTVTESVEVDEFDQIVIEGFGNVEVKQSAEQSVTIEGPEKTLDSYEIVVEDKVLYFRSKDEIGIDNFLTLIGSDEVTLYIEVPALKQIELSGAANVNVGNLISDEMSFLLSGTGNVEVDALYATKAAVDLSGAGNITIKDGSVYEQDVMLSGFGNYYGYGLDSAEATAELSGAGNVEMFVSAFLEADLSGAGNLSYKGSPEVTSDVSGVGNIQNAN